MQSKIILSVTPDYSVNWNTKIKDLPQRYIQTYFNFREAHLCGAYYDWEKNGYFILLQHEVFDEIKASELIPVFTLKQARKRYPFLFKKTNPLLYKKFIMNR